MGLKEAVKYILVIIVLLLGLSTSMWLYRYATGWGVYALQNVIKIGFLTLVFGGLIIAVDK